MGSMLFLNLAALSSLAENYPPDNTSLEFPFTTVSNLTEMLEQVYGPHGGRGLALRVGRACFNYGVRQYGTQMGLTEMAFRLLPLPTKAPCRGKSFCRVIQQVYRSTSPCGRRGREAALAHRTLSALLGAQGS